MVSGPGDLLDFIFFNFLITWSSVISISTSNSLKSLFSKNVMSPVSCSVVKTLLEGARPVK